VAAYSAFRHGVAGYYPHYFALSRTINWPTQKNRKIIGHYPYRACRKWGFKQMNKSTATQLIDLQPFRHKVFFSCNLKWPLGKQQPTIGPLITCFPKYPVDREL